MKFAFWKKNRELIVFNNHSFTYSTMAPGAGVPSSTVEIETKTLNGLEKTLKMCGDELKNAVNSLELSSAREKQLDRDIKSLLKDTNRDIRRLTDRLQNMEERVYYTRIRNAQKQQKDKEMVKNIAASSLSNSLTCAMLNELEDEYAGLQQKIFTVSGALSKHGKGGNIGEMKDQIKDMAYRLQHIEQMLHERTAAFHLKEGKLEVTRILMGVENILSFISQSNESGMQTEAAPLGEQVEQLRKNLEKGALDVNGAIILAKVNTTTGHILDFVEQQSNPIVSVDTPPITASDSESSTMVI